MLAQDSPVGPCGICCGWCPYYLTQVEGLKCPGCAEKGECPIRDCARRGCLELCTYCRAFPCDLLFGMYRRMGKFLKRVRKDFPEGV